MIQVENLCKSYGGDQVLTNVSFEAPANCITGFVGPNGAGKSTTMRIIASIEKPNSGYALVDDEPFSYASCPGKTMGVYLGSDYLPLRMTGKSFLSYVCSVTRKPRSRIAELLDAVDLAQAANKLIGSYSLGMKQRIGLAAALAGDPGTLMLDEPVNGLDPMGVQWLRKVLREQADNGKAVLLSSHLLTELELVADRVVMLDHGRIIATGDMADLERRSGSRVRVRTSSDDTLASLLAQRGVPVTRESDSIIVSGITTRAISKIAFENGLLIDHLAVEHNSLEEVFMEMTAQEGEGGQYA